MGTAREAHAPAPRPSAPSTSNGEGYEGYESYEGDEGREGHVAGRPREDALDQDGAEAERSAGPLHRAAGPCVHGSGEDGQVRNPAARHAQAEAQACKASRQAPDVRKRGEGGGEEGLEGGEGLPSEGSQDRHLSSALGRHV